jgi:hypothetical protein
MIEFEISGIKRTKLSFFFLRGGGAIKGKKYLIGDKLTTQY